MHGARGVEVERDASELHDTARTPTERSRGRALMELVVRMRARLGEVARGIIAYTEPLCARLERHTDTWERPGYVRDHARTSAAFRSSVVAPELAAHTASCVPWSKRRAAIRATGTLNQNHLRPGTPRRSAVLSHPLI
jgi:hypothetical protein